MTFVHSVKEAGLEVTVILELFEAKLANLIVQVLRQFFICLFEIILILCSASLNKYKKYMKSLSTIGFMEWTIS